MKKKLIFGDPESIRLRDREDQNYYEKLLMKKVKCPFCKAPAETCFEIDLKENRAGWNFKCKPNCVNSIEAVLEESNRSEDAEVWTDLSGKTLFN